MKVITITGPSGVGKGYLKDRIKQQWPNTIYELPWYCTRPQREDEQHRRDRICVTAREFATKKVLVTDEVAGCLYGLSADPIPEHRVALAELRCHLLDQLHFKDTFSIALVAHTDFLRARITQRATENEHEVTQRIKVAEGDMARMEAQHARFSFFYEVSADNEHLVVEQTIQALINYMPSKEICDD
jgi:guanylate kinase